MSLILIFRLRVFNSSERGISFHLTFAFPISVVTKLLFNISDFKFPDRVDKIIVLLFFSFLVFGGFFFFYLESERESFRDRERER